MAQRISAKMMVIQLAAYYGISLLDAYFDLVDMGEIRESDSLRRFCEKSS